MAYQKLIFLFFISEPVVCVLPCDCLQNTVKCPFKFVLVQGFYNKTAGSYLKSQSNFWLSFQKFLYAGIAYCYRLFRHFSLWKIFSNLLISPYVLVFKSSMWSSKFSVYYLCNQPLHFYYWRFGSRMRVIIQRHIDVGMSHDVLQCFGVHSRIC